MANPSFKTRQIADAQITAAKLAAGAAVNNLTAAQISTLMAGTELILNTAIADRAITALLGPTGFPAAAAYSSSTYTYPGGDWAISIPNDSTDLIVFQHASLKTATTSIRPQLAIRFDGLVYEGFRYEGNSMFTSNYVSCWWMYMIQSVSQGTRNLAAGFRSYDNNASVTCDGQVLWVIQHKK